MGRIGMMRGSGFSVLVMTKEADSAGSWELSKGLLPSAPEDGVATCGLDVAGCLPEEDRELEEDDSIAVEGICGRLEGPNSFSLPPPLELFKLAYLASAKGSPDIGWVLVLEEAFDDFAPDLAGMEVILTGLGGREANPVFADW